MIVIVASSDHNDSEPPANHTSERMSLWSDEDELLSFPLHEERGGLLLCWMWQGRRRRTIASKVSSCATLLVEPVASTSSSRTQTSACCWTAKRCTTSTSTLLLTTSPVWKILLKSMRSISTRMQLGTVWRLLLAALIFVRVPTVPVDAVTGVSVTSEVEADRRGLAGYLVKFQIRGMLKLTIRELDILRIVEELSTLSSQI